MKDVIESLFNMTPGNFIAIIILAYVLAEIAIAIIEACK